MNHMTVLEITVNGRKRTDLIPEDMTLLAYIRDHLGLTGTKCGCNAGECGACTVLLDGRAILSCSMLAVQAAGEQLETIEGLQRGDLLHPIQEAFIESGAVHCGFCTPGFILTAKAFLEQNHSPSEAEIRKAISGNLCRCTGYVQIVDAIRLAAKKMYPHGE
jgi:aerobic-type carbon monoxide dehydrogenase small subunit (CoxS/CutS family)